ncbi:hypothetical protein [Novosphingobium sp. Leaf2]|uniref:hypothetical protein n=1 Tax=Novosphingobium sp. Leaf2 TaxID=1735670 RepID=UPI000A5A9F7D|nr:hypothetical protein [Novosphingobium sp. Leaf2]
MNPNFDALLSDVVVKDSSAPSQWQYSKPPRKLHTYLTEKDFEEVGLAISKIAPEKILNPYVEPGQASNKASQWLVHGPANDLGHILPRPPWHAEIVYRIDNLKEIAAEERLPFNEKSAKAAMAFLSRLHGVRRPGAFLTNGNVRLLWDAPQGQQVGLQFRDEDKIQFIILQTDGANLGSLMGVKSSQAIFRLVMTPDVFSLIVDV